MRKIPYRVTAGVLSAIMLAASMPITDAEVLAAQTNMESTADDTEAVTATEVTEEPESETESDATEVAEDEETGTEEATETAEDEDVIEDETEEEAEYRSGRDRDRRHTGICRRNLRIWKKLFRRDHQTACTGNLQRTSCTVKWWKSFTDK